MDKEDLSNLIGLTEDEARAMCKLCGEPWVDVLYETRPGKWMMHAGIFDHRLTLKVNHKGTVEDAFWG